MCRSGCQGKYANNNLNQDLDDDLKKFEIQLKNCIGPDKKSRRSSLI